MNRQLQLDFVDSQQGTHPFLYTKEYGPWQTTHERDDDVFHLFNRHYSRNPKQVACRNITRPGRNIVLKASSSIGNAAWITWHGKYRLDGLDALECTMFRSEGHPVQSSLLIRWAVFASCVEFQWNIPKDGIITYVNAAKIQSSNPGFAYQKAGWKKAGKSKSGLILLQKKIDPISYLEEEVQMSQEERDYALRIMDIALAEGDMEDAMRTLAYLYDDKAFMDFVMLQGRQLGVQFNNPLEHLPTVEDVCEQLYGDWYSYETYEWACELLQQSRYFNWRGAEVCLAM